VVRLRGGSKRAFVLRGRVTLLTARALRACVVVAAHSVATNTIVSATPARERRSARRGHEAQRVAAGVFTCCRPRANTRM
jgi:hypothetical protein